MGGPRSSGAPAIAAPCCRLCAQDHILRSAVESWHPIRKRERANISSRWASDLVILFEFSQPKLPNFILTTKEAAAKPPKLCSVTLPGGQALDSSAGGGPVVWDPDSRSRLRWKRLERPKIPHHGKDDLKGSGCPIRHPPHKRKDPSRRKAAMSPCAPARRISLQAAHARFRPMGMF